MSRLLALVAALALASPASGVGLGPLRKEGITDGPRKGFYLTVINPYPQAETFILDPLAESDETPTARVVVIPARVRIAAGGNRTVLAMARDLAPGETYAFRVCAQRPPQPMEMVQARVCSTLRARRIARP